MTASSAPSCKQPGTPDAACAYPREGCATAGNVPWHSDQPVAAVEPYHSRHAPRSTGAVGRATQPLDQDRSPDVEDASRCVVSACEPQRTRTGCPITPVLPPGLRLPPPAFRRRRGPRPRGSNDRSVHHLVPYRLDTPTTPQVSPRVHRMFSDGWKSRLPLVTRSAQICQLHLKLQLRRCRRNRTSMSPTVTRAPGASIADARCLFSVESTTTRLRRPIEAPRREPRRSSSRSKRCETSVGHRGGLRRRDRVATIPTDQHALPGDRGEPNTTRSRLERAETHFRRSRAATSR